MNNDRRKEINKAIGLLQEAFSILEIARDEEQEYYENMPENLQSSERYQKAEDAYNQLESACSLIEEAIGECENAAE